MCVCVHEESLQSAQLAAVPTELSVEQAAEAEESTDAAEGHVLVYTTKVAIICSDGS